MKFITFEGIDGCGKSTMVKLLAEFLRKKGYHVFETKEPGGTEIGKKIRDILLNPKNKLSAKEEVLLFYMDRYLHVVMIKEKLKKGIVISDRFNDSTIAYQHYGRGIDFQFIKQFSDLLEIKPDITFVLDLPVEEGLKRLDKQEYGQEDRFEKENLEFHNRLRKGYLDIAKKEPNRIKVIDASRSKEKVFEEIRVHILSLITN